MAARPFAPFVLDLNYKARPRGAGAESSSMPSPLQRSSGSAALRPAAASLPFGAGNVGGAKKSKGGYDYLSALQESSEFNIRQTSASSPSSSPAPVSIARSAPSSPASMPSKAAWPELEEVEENVGAPKFSLSMQARESESKLQFFYDSNMRNFQQCDTSLRETSQMLCDFEVRAHILEANLVTMFDPTLEMELSRVADQAGRFLEKLQQATS